MIITALGYIYKGLVAVTIYTLLAVAYVVAGRQFSWETFRDDLEDDCAWVLYGEDLLPPRLQ